MMTATLVTEGYYTAVYYSNLTPTYLQGSSGTKYVMPRVMFYIEGCRVPLSAIKRAATVNVVSGGPPTNRGP
ncbi:hypothetical protein [Acidilobus sp.]|jgi:hypothetical protein|uniref:hypothetical protein n=1 Tax=Acidilobus sp. TaxID=1872109 RepID=UPI003D04BB78